MQIARYDRYRTSVRLPIEPIARAKREAVTVRLPADGSRGTPLKCWRYRVLCPRPLG